MARNLCLARIIGVDAYGSAMAIVMALAIVELVTHLGIPQQIVSRPDGARRHVQACLHGAQIIRGCVGGAAVLAIAYPLADFLGTPGLGWMLATSALGPVCLGLSHLDPFRAQRRHFHGPQVLLLIGPSALSLLALWPASLRTQGAELMLVLIGVQILSSTALSHFLARRPYRIKFERFQTLSLLKYGIPLAGNGVLLCAVLHAEKLIAGHIIGISALAFLAMGAALTMTPSLTIARSFQAYHLPFLRRSTQTPESAYLIMVRGCMTGAALAIVLAICTPFALEFLGTSFAQITQLLPVFIALACLRLPKSALATIALATGRTHIPMLANTPRLIALPVVWYTTQSGGGLIDMLGIALIAETLGLLAGLVASRRELDAPKIEIFAFVLVCTLIFAGQVLAAGAVLAMAIARVGLSRFNPNLWVVT